MDNILYTNENYQVGVTDDGSKYYIRNTQTGVVEGEETTLPQAYAQAEQMNRILRFDVWKTYAVDMYPDPVEKQKAELHNFPVNDKDRN